MDASKATEGRKRELFRRTFHGDNLDIRQRVRRGKTTVVVTEDVDTSDTEGDTTEDMQALKAT